MSTKDRGFASMPKEKVAQIARKGGQASRGGGRKAKINNLKNREGDQESTVGSRNERQKTNV